MEIQVLVAGQVPGQRRRLGSSKREMCGDPDSTSQHQPPHATSGPGSVRISPWLSTMNAKSNIRVAARQPTEIRLRASLSREGRGLCPCTKSHDLHPCWVDQLW